MNRTPDRIDKGDFATLRSTEVVPTNTGFVLLTENVDEPLAGTPFHTDYFNTAGGRLVASMNELAATVGSGNCVIGIAFNMSDRVDWNWVRSQYEQGVVIAGVGMNIQELHSLVAPSVTPVMEKRGESWSDALSLYGRYPPERWPTSYITLQVQGHRGHYGDGQFTLLHPEFGWKTHWIERLITECNANEKRNSAIAPGGDPE